MSTFWLALAIICLVVEIATIGLTSIWLAGGAIVAFLCNLLGADVFWQITAFFAVTVVLMVFTRPWAKKFLNKNCTKTNYEEVLGKLVRVTEKIDDLNETGVAVYNGLEWTARSKNPSEIFEVGSHVRVVDVMGVKLIVEHE